MALSVSITTYNEENNIERLLKNLKNFADEIIIVDGQSKDNTVNIAKKYTKKIIVVPNNLNLNINKQKGIEICKNEWILYMDADEILTPELKKEITTIISGKTSYNGFYIPRKGFLFGRWITHGGYYPDLQLRLFRNKKGHFDLSSVHAILQVKGKIGRLKRDIHHINFYKSLYHFVQKINDYTTTDANLLIKEGKKKTLISMCFKPIALFLYLYIYRLGFLDKRYGLIFAISSAYYEFLLHAKYFELIDIKKINEFKK